MKVIILIAVTLVVAVSGKCPPGFIEIRTSFTSTRTECFHIVPTKQMNQKSAMIYCNNMKATLWEPREFIEYITVWVRARTISSTVNYWLGINDKLVENRFVYNSNNQPIVYSRFQPGSNTAANDCATFSGRNTNWFLLNCYTTAAPICKARASPNCFEQDRLFVEGSFPFATTLTQCQQACVSATPCQFFTWNTGSRACGLRFFRPGGVVKARGQRTGTRTSILPTPDRVFVGRALFAANAQACQLLCQRESRCISVTYNDATSENPRICVLNFGPTIRRLPLPSGSGVSSAPKFCPTNG